MPSHPQFSLAHRNMAPASSFLISGIFFLSDGSRSTNPPYYAQYLSALDFLNPDRFINVSIRKYTPPSEPLYAEETVVFLVAKAALPAGEDGMLDTIHCTPFQSSWESFQESLPPGPTHTASVTGTIGAVSNVGAIRSFTVNASEYVRDERRGFTIRSVFPRFLFIHCSFAQTPGSNSKRIQVAGRTFVCRPQDLQSSLPGHSKVSQMGMASPFSHY